ncbi:MAG: exopolysaccharide biosynthesis protein [Sphingomonas bacterium]|uniref:GumC family protein n=1 Tax=Sphingomonas bacterium TaxID=1895847 RepID=UPI002616B64A|nr:polysaccharide biosynthesis tyrosine autokinase [Sphingomonas bacterium]MDB5703914.1 exopolysaccharide biosynthesis protein [Sphingomonas bacterium]
MMDSISPRALGLTAPGDLRLFAGDAAPDVGAAPRMPPLKRLLRVIVRWRWVLGTAIIAGFMLGLIVTLITTRQYTSTVRVEIARETTRVVEIDSVQRDTSVADQEFYQTQYGLLQSQTLAERVARELRLVDDPAFFEMFGRKGVFKGDRVQQSTPAARAKRNDLAGKLLLQHVGVVPVRGSRLVDVSAVTPDPALSQRIANTWALDFINMNLERRFEATGYARRFLEGRLEQIRQKLEESERNLVGYASAQDIINLPGSVNQKTGETTGERSLLSDDLTALNAALASATADRIEAQSRLSQARTPDATSESLSNQAIGELRQKRAQAASDYAQLMGKFEPGYPAAKGLALQIASLDQAIAREENRVRTSLQQIYASSLARERALMARVNSLKGGLTDFRRRSIQYNIYQRDADTNRELYNGLLQRYKEIGVAGGIENNNISVVDPAKLPDRPSKPNLMLNLILFMFAGLVVGGMIAWALEQIDEGITDPGEVESELGVPLLGVVPRSGAEGPLDALQNPKSPLVEAYLAVQTSLELATAHGAPKSIAITSTRPQEGKSVTAFALAQSLARARRKVVLIDADLRSPSVHREFGLKNDLGVSNFLAGADNIDAALHKTDRPGLSIMTAGPQPPNAADLLTGDGLRNLIALLLERFDHVVVDSPPVMGLADAPLVASAVEGVIFAVEARSIRTSIVRVALGRLHASNARLLGIVLTKFESKRAHFGYGYEYGYGYGQDRLPRPGKR